MTRIGDIVYLKCGDDNSPKIVTGILRRKGSVNYELRTGVQEPTWHFGFEFQKEKPKGRKIAGLYPEK